MIRLHLHSHFRQRIAMSVTTKDLARFTQFAAERIDGGHASSLEECLKQWREYLDVNAAVDRGLEDIAAGRFRPVEEFWQEFCDEHGIAAQR
jgi:predicted transcriptional regulator